MSFHTYPLVEDTTGNIPYVPYTETLTDIPNQHWGKNGTSIYNQNGGNVGIGNNSPAYLLDVNGNTNINGTLYANYFNGNGANITNLNYNNITNPPNLGIYATTAQLSLKQDSLSAGTTLYGNGANITSLNYNNITNPPSLSGFATTAQLATKQDTLTASTSLLGNGSAITSLNYNNITNPPSLSGYATTAQLNTKQDTLTSATSLLGNGANITSLNYNNITNPPSLNDFVTTAQLNTKQDTLTASTSLLGNGSAITSLNYNNITNPPSLSGFATTAQLNTKQDTLTASTSLLGDGANITNLTYTNITGRPDLSDYATTTQLATKQDTLTSTTALVGNGSAITNINYNNINGVPDLSQKENTLTFNSPLIRTINTIDVSYDNTTIGLNANNQLAVISGGGSQWTTSGNNIYYNSGFVGVAITNPEYELDVDGVVRISGGIIIAPPTIPPELFVRQFNLIGSLAGMRIYRITGNPTFELIYKDSTPTNTTDYLYWWDFLIEGTALTGHFVIRDRSSKSYKNRFRITNTGACVIHTDTTALATPTIATYGGSGDKLIFTTGSATEYPYSFGVNTSTLWYSVPSTASHRFYIGGTEYFTILSGGNVGIGNNNPTYKLTVNGSLNSTSLYTGGRIIQDHLFNNSGRIHTTYTDFNTPTDFGCHFIAGNTNSPAVNVASQYYSMTLGLGNEYYNGAPGGNYRLQLAYPRINNGYPYITMRTMENGTWGGWMKTACGLADNAVNSTSTNFLNANTNTWHTSTEGSLRFYFSASSHTYFGTSGSYIFRHSDTVTDICQINETGMKLKLPVVTDSGTDYLGVQVNAANGTTQYEFIKIMYNSFTGFHRLFCDDELFDRTNETTMNDFKNNYIGRVVCSTGKIKTHTQENGKTDWFVVEDKDGIKIENAHCVVRLSNKKKDKSVVGVIGLNRNNSAPDRIIVNSLGEGAIWVLNTNGNIENGDLLNTSDELGYAEKQDDDIVRNYTIGKSMINCSFELNSPYYETKDLGNGIIAAFIACFYYCG